MAVAYFEALKMQTGGLLAGGVHVEEAGLGDIEDLLYQG